MSLQNYADAYNHLGHTIVCILYPNEVCIECETCCEVLSSYKKK